MVKKKHSRYCQECGTPKNTICTFCGLSWIGEQKRCPDCNSIEVEYSECICEKRKMEEKLKKQEVESVIGALNSEIGKEAISKTISNEFKELSSEENSTNQKKFKCKFCERTNEDTFGNKVQIWKTEEICMDCAKTRLCLVCQNTYNSSEHNINCSNTKHL